MRIGEPVCRGPVCNWCYETKVAPVQARSKSTEGGAWVFRSADGLTVSDDPWWVAHEMASALEPGASEEDVCAAAEAAVAVPPMRGGAWTVMGIRVPWMSRVLLQSPAGLIPSINRLNRLQTLLYFLRIHTLARAGCTQNARDRTGIS